MIGVSKSAYSLEIAVTALLLFVTLPAESKESSKQRNYKWEDLKRHGQESEMHGLLRVAEQYYRKSIDEALKATGNSSNEYIESTVRLANVLVLQRKFLEAEPYFKKSLEFTEQRRKESSFDREILVWLDDLADSYQTNAEGVKEINCSEHALKLRDLISEHGRHQKLASSLRPLILEYMDKKRFADAAAAAKRLVKADQATYGHLSMRAANDLYTLAELELRLHHLDESESYARQAMSIYLGTENALKLGLVNIRVLLAQVLFERGEISLADK